MSGTGFAVGTGGHILTNNHVVGGCSQVQLSNAMLPETDGEVVGRDVRNDLALIRLPAHLPAVAAFRPSPLRPGDDVIALGYPYRGLLAADASKSMTR
jgi:S1-C subfamily serine protease